MKAIADDLRAGRGSAGKFLTDDEFYVRINRTADRLDKSVDSINLLIADVNAGRGTLGKLIRDEQIYNDARAAIARFNTTAERIDNLVAAAQRGEGTVGRLTQRRRTLYKRKSTLFRRREDALRLPPKPEEVPDDQVRAVLTRCMPFTRSCCGRLLLRLRRRM